MAKIHLPKSIKRFKDWSRHIRRLHLVLPLWWRNRMSRQPIVHIGGPAVSLTTYGTRTRRVYLAIESIGRGHLRPSTVTLWLDEAAVFNQLPLELQRLVQRGLTVRLTPNYGPHKKYYPQVTSDAVGARLPLVTADDDTLYPAHWLATLYAAHTREPGLVHCWRAKRIQTTPNGIAPYNQWPDCADNHASHAHFAIGCSGVIYPPRLQAALAAAGDGFMQVCPKADDLWLHLHSLRNGFKVRQIQQRAVDFPCIPGTESVGLVNFNVNENGNDLQLLATYSADDISAVLAAARTGP